MNRCVCFLFLLIACVDSFKYETRVFEEYYFNTFEEKLTTEPHLFMICSNFKCSGCIQKTFLFMEELCAERSVQNVSVITSDLQLVPKNIRDKTEVLIDSLALFDRLDIGVANVTLVEVKDKKVVMVKSIQLNEIEMMLTTYLVPFIH